MKTFLKCNHYLLNLNIFSMLHSFFHYSKWVWNKMMVEGVGGNLNYPFKHELKPTSSVALKTVSLSVNILSSPAIVWCGKKVILDFACHTNPDKNRTHFWIDGLLHSSHMNTLCKGGLKVYWPGSDPRSDSDPVLQCSSRSWAWTQTHWWVDLVFTGPL